MSLLAATRVIKEYATTRLAIEPVFHGSFTSVDDAMKGTVRFGKKLGSDAVTISSDVEMTLAADASVGDSELLTNTKVAGAVAGSLFKLPNTALLKLGAPEQKIDSTGMYWSWEISASTELTEWYDVGSPITIYGHPASVLIGLGNSIQVRATCPVVPGDRLIPIEDTGAGLLEGRHVELLTVGDPTVIPATTPVHSYTCTVDPSLVHLLNAEQLFVKADVAYTSRPIPATELNGSFRVDCVSGTTLGDEPEDITITINVLQSDYSVARSYQDVRKNTTISLGATPAADLATGAVEYGRLVPMYDGSLFSVNDANGVCGFGYDFVSSMEAGLRLSAAGQEGTEIRVSTDQGTVLYKLGATATVIDLMTTVTSHVIFRVTGPARGTVLWKSLPRDEDCAFISYSVVSRIRQSNRWSGSGLILKPVISSIKDSYAVVNGTTFIINGGAFL